MPHKTLPVEPAVNTHVHAAHAPHMLPKQAALVRQVGHKRAISNSGCSHAYTCTRMNTRTHTHGCARARMLAGCGARSKRSSGAHKGNLLWVAGRARRPAQARAWRLGNRQEGSSGGMKQRTGSVPLGQGAAKGTRPRRRPGRLQLQSKRAPQMMMAAVQHKAQGRGRAACKAVATCWQRRGEERLWALMQP